MGHAEFEVLGNVCVKRVRVWRGVGCAGLVDRCGWG